jgi:hypothetical protein
MLLVIAEWVSRGGKTAEAGDGFKPADQDEIERHVPLST